MCIRSLLLLLWVSVLECSFNREREREGKREREVSFDTVVGLFGTVVGLF
jgi:hypothetical protein